VIVDCAVYDEGHRRPGELALEDAFDAARSGGDSFAWIGLAEPTEDEFVRVQKEFGLHPLAVEDAIKAHQRPKVELYDDSLFVVIKVARYADPEEIVEIGEVMAFLGRHFIVTVRHGSGLGLSDVRTSLESRPEVLTMGPGAVLHAVLDRVVDEYQNVVVGLDGDVDEIEDAVFRPGRSNYAERIYRLKREVLEFRRAVVPLGPALEKFLRHPTPVVPADLIPEALRPYLRDVYDHVMRAAEQVDQIDGLLSGVLDAQLAQLGVAQNDDMRKISAWVAIAAVPTMLAGIYGMNFRHMPELGWRFGYLYVLLVMGGACFLLYRAFRRSGWL
jgi:magnesium transporter